VEADAAVPGPALEKALHLCLGATDLVGNQGPGNFEIVLADKTPEMIDLLCRRFMEILEEHQNLVRLAVACYPRDAHSPDLLFAKARPTQAGEWSKANPGGAILQDPKMLRIQRLLERVAPSNINVMIQGETGVGKEVIARLIHQLSHRPAPLFVSVNCAALPQSLLESELFGYERGAFTSASQSKPGLLEIAEEGTFLLDEVSEMPLGVQAKLLRVIEERKAVRLGGLKPYRIGARFIATTNRDIAEAVRRGEFREDLYYRLEGILLVIPPLRDRPAEIEPLAKTFIRQISQESNCSPAPALTDEALACLQEQRWPGNVRELRNVIERAVLLCSDNRITRTCVGGRTRSWRRGFVRGRGGRPWMPATTIPGSDRWHRRPARARRSPAPKAFTASPPSAPAGCSPTPPRPGSRTSCSRSSTRASSRRSSGPGATRPPRPPCWGSRAAP
jgi:two-component system, NtrC family, response regulator AtoC